MRNLAKLHWHSGRYAILDGYREDLYCHASVTTIRSLAQVPAPPFAPSRLKTGIGSQMRSLWTLSSRPIPTRRLLFGRVSKDKEDLEGSSESSIRSQGRIPSCPLSSCISRAIIVSLKVLIRKTLSLPGTTLSPSSWSQTQSRYP